MKLPKKVEQLIISGLQYPLIVQAVLSAVYEGNAYFSDSAPWKLRPRPDRGAFLLATADNTCRSGCLPPTPFANATSFVFLVCAHLPTTRDCMMCLSAFASAVEQVLRVTKWDSIPCFTSRRRLCVFAV